jgi:hypothetical protein
VIDMMGAKMPSKKDLEIIKMSRERLNYELEQARASERRDVNREWSERKTCKQHLGLPMQYCKDCVLDRCNQARAEGKFSEGWEAGRAELLEDMGLTSMGEPVKHTILFGDETKPAKSEEFIDWLEHQEALEKKRADEVPENSAYNRHVSLWSAFNLAKTTYPATCSEAKQDSGFKKHLEHFSKLRKYLIDCRFCDAHQEGYFEGVDAKQPTVFTDETVEKVATYLWEHDEATSQASAKEDARFLLQSCGFKSEMEIRLDQDSRRKEALIDRYKGGQSNPDEETKKLVIASWLESEEKIAQERMTKGSFLTPASRDELMIIRSFCNNNAAKLREKREK